MRKSYAHEQAGEGELAHTEENFSLGLGQGQTAQPTPRRQGAGLAEQALTHYSHADDE
jgi:hypothetical protein